MKYLNAEIYLSTHGIEFKSESSNKELRINCPFCRHHNNKCYVENSTGRFYCFHCGESGSWRGLVERLGNIQDTIEKSGAPKEESEDLPPIELEIIEQNHQRLLTSSCLEVRKYLYNRGLNDSTLAKFKLGWDGRNITIPIFDANGDCMNFKLKRDPTLPSGSKGMFSILGRGRKRLFNEGILRQNSDYVVVCEGEWDCMLLDQYGFPTVTSTGGASSFDESWVPYFWKFSKVYICFDNDRNGAGQDGTRKTVSLLYRPEGTKVLVVQLPDPSGVDKKIDVTDYFVKLGKSKDNFEELFEKATEPTIPTQNQRQVVLFKPISISELMSKEFSDTQWVVEQLLPAEAIVAISGLPSAYKTWLILYLAIEVARGGVLFDKFTTAKTGVLIIDEETGERWIQQRVSKLQCEVDLPIYLLSRTGFKLTEVTVKQLLSFAKEKKIGLIIFDSFLRIHTARDENDAVEMAKVFNLFQRLNREGITTAFTHHHRKPGPLRSSNPSQDMRGSSDILAAVDCHLAIERKDEVVIITQTKLRQGEEIRPFKLNIINDESELRFEFAGEVDEEQTKKADWKESIKDYLSEQDVQKYKKEMFDQLKGAGVEGGYSTFKTAVKELVDRGELFEKPGEKNKVYCSLKPFTDEQISLLEGSSDQSG